MSKKVLVAEDSSVMRRILVMYLNNAGITDVTQAADGEEAMNYFNQSTYDLVLTDWNMPKKSGLEVLKEIRARNATVPVMLITTEAERRRVLEAIQAGVTDYLTKPFSGGLLSEKIEKYTKA